MFVGISDIDTKIKHTKMNRVLRIDSKRKKSFNTVERKCSIDKKNNMKKIKLLVAAVFLSLFFWAMNVSAEDVVAIDEDAVTIDNVTYIFSDLGGSWLACSGLGHESTERLVIRDEIRGMPVGTIVAQGFSFTDAQEIVLLNTDVIIYMEAFADSGIRTLTIPASVKLVDEGLAARCKNLETVYWNAKLGIPDYAFTHCTALRSVTLPENLTSIGAAAFSGCRSLKEIYIPSSVSYIDARAFDNIPELTIASVYKEKNILMLIMRRLGRSHSSI